MGQLGRKMKSFWPGSFLAKRFARVTQLVDVGALKVSGLYDRAGSNPAPGTFRKKEEAAWKSL